MTKILDGKWLASKFHHVIKNQVEGLLTLGRPPGLAVIIVGDDPASKAYVKNKGRVAKKKCGFETFDFVFPVDATFNQVADAIKTCNEDKRVDGILMQLPLPEHLDANELLNLIDPAKDVDGLHPLNQGLLLRGTATLKPCTPLGVMKLLDLADTYCPDPANFDVLDMPEADLSGKHAVVIGRSILVGKPVAFMLLARNATVSIIHSRTENKEELSRSADILIPAVGREEMVTSEWVKDGATVIDVGINRTADGKLTGDVAFEEVQSKTSAITPVPGGVGPMTVAMLMWNTLLSYKERV